MNPILYLLFRLVRILIELESFLFALVRHYLLQNRQSCEVLSIVARGRFNVGDVARDCDFISFHDHFAPIDILFDAKWMLYALSERHAYFTLMPEDSLRYTADHAPFVGINQLYEARLLAKISHKDLIEFSYELGEMRGKVVFLTNSICCGSTLLTKAIQATDPSKHIVSTLSEPDAFSNLSVFLDDGRWSLEYFRRLLGATLRVVCKEQKDKQIFFIKARSNCVRLVPHIQAIAPKVGLLFMYRQSLEKMVSSLLAASESCENALGRTILLRNIHPLFADFVTLWSRVEARMMQMIQPTSELELALVIITSPWLEYQKDARFFTLPVFFYEELLSKPAKVLLPILRLCGLPERNVDTCIEYLKSLNQEISISVKEGENTPPSVFLIDDMEKIAKITKLIGFSLRNCSSYSFSQ